MLTHQNKQAINPHRVVILGAGGFVSSAIQRKLTASGISVFALSRKDLDLTQANSVEKLSALLLPDDSLLFASAKAPAKDEGMLIENLLMGKTVCQAIKKSPVAHLVYISSDAVYADSEGPLTEKSCAQPESLHGVMHLSREVMLANAFAGPLCFLRPTLIYGKEDPHNGYGPNRFVRLAKAGENIQLFGNGEELRDHVWIEDVADIAVSCLKMRSTGVLNCATGEVASFFEIAEKSASLAKTPIEILKSNRVGAIPHNGYRPFDPANTYMAFPDFKYKSLLTELEKL